MNDSVAQLSDGLKKRWKLIIVVVLVFLLILTIFLRARTPQALPSIAPASIPPLNESLALTSEATIAFQVETPPLPASMKVVSAKAFSVDELNIKQRLNLQPTDFETTWQSVDKKSALLFDEYQKRYAMSIKTGQGDFDASLISIVDPKKAEATAISYANNILGITLLQPDTSDFEYLKKGAVHPEVSSESEANIVLIPFVYKIDGYNVFIDNNLEPPMVVFVDSTNTVTGFSMSEYLFNPINEVLVETVTQDELIAEIRAGRVTIIRTKKDNDVHLLSDPGASILITKINLEYRFSSQSQSIAPYYNMTATIETQTGKPVVLDFLVSAVRNEVK